LWLFGVARYVLANRRRADVRRRRLHMRLASQPAPGPAAAAAVSAGPEPAGPDPGLAAALAALDDASREVLVMRHWDELAVHEIAALLDCTPNAVSLRLHKAKRRLAGLLSAKDPAVAGQVGGDPAARKDRGHE
jgi:RNA polymerase sigma-70 factor, ECF subfamily